MPSTFKKYNVFIDGHGLAGQIEEYEPPQIKLKIEDFQGAGMLGPVGMMLGVEALDGSLTLGGQVREVLRRFGGCTHNGVIIRIMSAYQSDDTCAVDATEETMRVRLVGIEQDAMKQGDHQKIKVPFKCSYYKKTVNGEIDIEADLINGKLIIAGVDQMAKLNAAVGIF